MSVAIILALTTVALACEASPPASDGGPLATNAGAAALLPGHVSDLPSFDFDTYERLMYQLRGMPVVVNIWASWCGPCRQEAPVLADAARRYGKDVQFLGVDYQDGTNPAIAFIATSQLPYPSVADGSGDIHDQLGFIGLPDTVFYGADGTIVSTWSGPITADALSEGIDRLLHAGAGQTP
jgi:cytochrome c biogenesis protein CcmG, thiol:disulfide interchange protein DsbE